MLQQWNDVHAVPFEDSTFAQVEGMERQGAQFLRHSVIGAGKKAGADAMGDVAEAEIEACGLNLIVNDRFQRSDLASALDRVAQ